MMRSCSALLASGILMAALSGCVAGAGPTSPSGGQSPAASPPTSAVASPSATGPSLRDPMEELAEGSHGSSLQGQEPLLSQQGSAEGHYTLPPAGATQAVLTVSCVGPGRYTVRGDGEVLLDSACTGRAAANILLPLEKMGSRIDVTAPGDFWVVIVPTH